VKVIHQENQKLAEGPLWQAGNLYWVDIKACNLHRLNLSTNSHETRHFQEQLTSISPAVSGDFIVTTRHGVARLARFEADLIPLVDVESAIASNRFNDAKVDTNGELWAGTMDDGETDATGSLYRIGTDLSVSKEDTGYYITNGPTFSPDGTYLYHTDSAKKEIYRFKLSANGLSERQLFISLGDAHGHPDGMTVDANGCIWVCEYGGWGISKFDHEGNFLSKLDLPVSNVTSCTFGGDNLDVLFVTSAAKGLTASELEEQPMAGSIFQLVPGVTGLETNVFGG
jgi:D-xylonolactonase